jgi:BirA family biotin operon repressor/biotin-[acetyl-CoA-carboxylase] ligase
MGRTLLPFAETRSTNDDAWAALGQGMPDGVTVVADAQTRGRGRGGRSWSHAPARGLALSVALQLGWDSRHAGVVPLAAGLALARAVARLGVSARLKWPNDVLVDGRKLAGVLCEMRSAPGGGEAIVVGVGMNVRQRAEDFPQGLRESATSLAQCGSDATPEDAAAEFLNAFEPVWDLLRDGRRDEVLDAWSEHAAFWGEPVTVRTPSGLVTGVAQRLDREGGLVLRLESGAEVTVLAGDLEPGTTGGRER